METNPPSRAPSVPKPSTNSYSSTRKKKEVKKEKEEKKKKNAKVMEQVDAVLGPNENGKRSAEAK